MAGTLTVSYSKTGKIATTTLDWVSDSSGNVNGTSFEIHGVIQRVVFIPSSDPQPSDNYDVILKGTGDTDLLAGQGANLSNSSNTHICPAITMTDGTTANDIPFVVSESIELDVQNAGDTKEGQIVILHTNE